MDVNTANKRLRDYTNRNIGWAECVYRFSAQNARPALAVPVRLRSIGFCVCTVTLASALANSSCSKSSYSDLRNTYRVTARVS